MTESILSYQQEDSIKLLCEIDLKKLLSAPKVFLIGTLNYKFIFAAQDLLFVRIYGVYGRKR